MDKSLMLAIDTSGRTGSAAVGIGDTILAEGTLSGHLRHGSELFNCCQRLFRYIGKNPADVNLICISSGPGSFTGVRIATTMAKIFALANDAKIVALSTMDVISANIADIDAIRRRDIHRTAVVLDAKRGQFYMAGYTRTGDKWIKNVDDCLVTPDEFHRQLAQHDHRVWLLGEGLVYHRGRFEHPRVGFLDEQYWYPKARNVYALGHARALRRHFDDPAAMLPRYLRQPEAIERRNADAQRQS